MRTFFLFQVEETERLWSACVLYVLRRLSNGGSAGGDRDDNQGDKLDIDCPAGFTLSQLLRETKLRCVFSLPPSSLTSWFSE